MDKKKNIYEKIWDSHIVHDQKGQAPIIYIDAQFMHEVTSAQAFEGLRLSGREVRRAEKTFATMDHNIPTIDRALPIKDPMSLRQVETLRKNCKEFGVLLFDMDSDESGIIHVIGPELGLSLPGSTIVCGDSHTSTHGAFGALAFGIGTSEVEHVLVTQTLIQNKSKTMEVCVTGKIPKGVFAKDIILAIIGKIGTAGGTGYVVEYTGETIKGLSMEERMTICNMSIEAGARAGLISPDKITFEYLKGRPYIPNDRPWEELVREWSKVSSDEGCSYDANLRLNVDDLEPQVTWGTSPGMVGGISSRAPVLADIEDEDERSSLEKALDYMGIKEGAPLEGLAVDKVFLGSCTNGRIQDMRQAAKVVKGYKVYSSVCAIVVPGSQSVKKAAEAEGLDKIFTDAGFEWRESGCSMCLGMNPDQIKSGERCASTSNRNFEGRQGKGARTHLVSPAMAAAAAIEGKFVDVREWKYR